MGNDKILTLRRGDSVLELALPDPEAGLYRGVRFDHAGIFREIRFRGHVYSGRWLDGPADPCRHDDVTGPVEEFSAMGYDEAPVGGAFLKIGVGLLRKTSEAPYDFRVNHPLLGGGPVLVRAEEDAALFRQELSSGPWSFTYEKTVRWEDDGVLVLDHHLANAAPGILSGTVYNHHFFTFDDARTGIGTAVDFPFEPAGTWREWPGDAPVGELFPAGIRLRDDVPPGCKVCIEHLRAADGGPMPYRFTVRNLVAGLGVRVSSEAPVCRIQFWGNERVACVEPYTPFSLGPGESFDWRVTYRFF